VELGSSFGFGQVVAIKAKDPSGAWVEMYKGAALRSEYETLMRTRTYWRWSPDACRVHFMTTEFRIEMDTSEATGIAAWNYIDFIRVFGATSIQTGALPTGATHVIYVPEANSFGTDSFDFMATDCPGDDYRSSTDATISLFTAAVNDPPTLISIEGMLVPIGTDALAFRLPVADVDEPHRLEIIITQLPDVGQLLEGQRLITHVPAVLAMGSSSNLTYVPPVHFEPIDHGTQYPQRRALQRTHQLDDLGRIRTSLSFQATDSQGLSSNLSLSLHIAVCSPGSGMGIEQGVAQCVSCTPGTSAPSLSRESCWLAQLVHFSPVIEPLNASSVPLVHISVQRAPLRATHVKSGCRLSLAHPFVMCVLLAFFELMQASQQQ
jgi:hypothetical protein